MLGLCKCVPPKPVTGGWLRQCLGSVTARRERMYVAYGAALRACGSERFPNTLKK